MARVPYLDVSDLKPDDQDLLKRPINLFRALVHSPGAARGWSTIGHYIRYGSNLDPRLREMRSFRSAIWRVLPMSGRITSRSVTISASAMTISAPLLPKLKDALPASIRSTRRF